MVAVRSRLGPRHSRYSLQVGSECVRLASVSRSNRGSAEVEEKSSFAAQRLSWGMVAHTGFEPVLPP